MGIAGKPAQVRNHEAVRVETTNCPFMTSPLPIAGFAIIEAADMAEATAMVSQAPCAVRKMVSDYNSLGRLQPGTISPTRKGDKPCPNS
jgi:hypothetical protein